MSRCTCTTTGTCTACRPPCEHCGDHFFARLAGHALCAACYELVLHE